MENYINVLRCILKNFNIRKNNEFDNIIKYIINKIVDEYYNNRDKSKYCIDNLIRKHTIRYFDLQYKYGTVLSLKLEISSFICNSVINLPSLRDIL